MPRDCCSLDYDVHFDAENARGDLLDYRANGAGGATRRLLDVLIGADVVTLDRVICCYHDVHSLVSRSAKQARRLYGLVYPLDRWWTRSAFWIMNLVTRLQRSDYRAYVHSEELVDRLIREAGLELRYHHAGMVWQTAVYARGNPIL
jgi:hypothetical protein